MTSYGFYTPPQLADIKARASALTLLDSLATTAYGRTPDPLALYDLPGIYNVPWSQWWDIAQTITLDTDATHQLALAGSLMGQAQQDNYYSKAQSFIDAWVSKNKGATENQDSPLSWCETVPGFIFADIIMSVNWPGRAAFLTWLQKYLIPIAASIQTRVNNWGAWGTFAKIMGEIHTGGDPTPDIAVLRSQILAMINANGVFPQEMLRVGAQLWYSYYCAVPLTCACREVMWYGGPNFFADPQTGPRIQAAVNNILSMALNPTTQTGKPVLTAAQPWPYDLVDAMAEQYNNDNWRAAAAPFAPISYWQHHTGWNFPTLTALSGL